MSTGPEQILVLAGSRGPSDPLAQHAGVSHKALIRIGGIPMVERVVGTLHAMDSTRSIVVAIEQPDLLTSLPSFKGALADGRLRIVPTAASPSQTVAAALQNKHVAPPFLITTADHPLLTAGMIDHFWQRVPQGTDAAVAVASEEVISLAWPETRRTYIRFAKEGYSGCNLFAVMTAEAQGVIEFWHQVESRRKQPLSMIRLLGPLSVVRYLLGRMTLDAAVIHLGHLTESRLAVVTLPFAEAAMDVDKPDDIALAERILAARHSAKPAG